MGLEEFLGLCARAARDVELDDLVIKLMRVEKYCPEEDLKDDQNSHFLWLETLIGYIRMEVGDKTFEFAPIDDEDLYTFSLGKLYELFINPPVRPKRDFMLA